MNDTHRHAKHSIHPTAMPCSANKERGFYGTSILDGLSSRLLNRTSRGPLPILLLLSLSLPLSSSLSPCAPYGLVSPCRVEGAGDVEQSSCGAATSYPHNPSKRIHLRDGWERGNLLKVFEGGAERPENVFIMSMICVTLIYMCLISNWSKSKNNIFHVKYVYLCVYT